MQSVPTIKRPHPGKEKKLNRRNYYCRLGQNRNGVLTWATPKKPSDKLSGLAKSNRHKALFKTVPKRRCMKA